MRYYSTGRKSENVSFRDAILLGLAPDRGLYMPERLHRAPDGTFDIDKFDDLAFTLSRVLVDGEIPDDDLRSIVYDAFDFDVPLKNINDNIYALELYHGPTAAFKDFGARFMARVMNYFLAKDGRKLTILVATSGDTGSAVAKGFFGLDNIDVVILYPTGKVSILQEKQLTTLGGNIKALEVNGTFDQCQFLVKEAFMDENLKSKRPLSSANSINIGRLYPQSFYYCWAYNLIKKRGIPVFCTPSGNFGNLTGGVIAGIMGMPYKKFIAATNINDTIPEFLSTGVYRARPSVKTYSNAMDVGDPSNFARLIDIFKTKDSMQKAITGFSVTDSETADAMKMVYSKYKYMLDPHGAVGYHAISKHIEETGDVKTPYILLETAHPAKFGEVIQEVVGVSPEIPETLKGYLDKEKVSVKIEPDYAELKNYLLK